MTEVKKEKKKEKKIEKVVINAIATDDGYYKGSIIRTGEKFVYEGVTKDGKLPLWVAEAKKKKYVEVDDSAIADLV